MHPLGDQIVHLILKLFYSTIKPDGTTQPFLDDIMIHDDRDAVVLTSNGDVCVTVGVESWNLLFFFHGFVNCRRLHFNIFYNFRFLSQEESCDAAAKKPE